jgi:hypothetical protein
MEKKPNILLINPWIYDFAAHDLWSKPLGLLMLAGLLRAQGYNLSLLDCLDVHDSRLQAIPGLLCNNLIAIIIASVSPPKCFKSVYLRESNQMRC